MKKEIISQYHASLNMLHEAIEKCPDDLWNNNKEKITYWRITYHALFFTSLYLSESVAKFTLWDKHKENYECLGEVTFDKKPVIIKSSYSRKEMLEYADSIFEKCETYVNESTLNAKCGFDWLPFNDLEKHLYNIRHIQHHTGQLVERLHQNGIEGIKWETFG